MVSVLPGFDQQLLEGLGKTQPCLLMAWSSDQLGQKREVGAGGVCVNTRFLKDKAQTLVSSSYLSLAWYVLYQTFTAYILKISLLVRVFGNIQRFTGKYPGRWGVR